MAKKSRGDNSNKIQVILITSLFLILMIFIISGANYKIISDKINKMVSPTISGFAIGSGGSGMQGCYDSDGGIKSYVFGMTSNNGIIYNDRCGAGNRLTEYYCSTISGSGIDGSGSVGSGSGSTFDGNVNSISISCPDGCNIGTGKCNLNAPTNLVVNLVSVSEIDLSWADNSNAETGFDILRSSDGITWNIVGSTVSNTNNYIDMNLNNITNYQYRVRAKNEQTISSYAGAFTSTGNVKCYSDYDCLGTIIPPTGPNCTDVAGSNASCLIYPSSKCINPGTFASVCIAYDRYVCTQCAASCNIIDGLCSNQKNFSLQEESNINSTNNEQNFADVNINSETNANSNLNPGSANPNLALECSSNKAEKIIIGDSTIIPINNKNYLISIDFMTSDSVKLKINDIATSNLREGDSYQIANGIFLQVYSILSQNYQGGAQEADIIIYYNCNIQSNQAIQNSSTNPSTTANPLTSISVRILCKLSNPFNTDSYSVCVNQKSS